MVNPESGSAGNGGWFGPLPRERECEELMDRIDGCSDAEIALALGDLERVNRVFGNHRLVTRHLDDLIRGLPADGEILLLDIGTGGGDLPAAAARWAGRSGRRLRVLALDREPAFLRFARRRLAGVPGSQLLAADAARLPFADRAVDIVLCSQVLHHLTEEDGIRVLSEMNRVSRIGWIVSDLRRGRLAHLLTRVAMRWTTRNRIIRYDGPLSILRAYTLPEYRRLARAAGAGAAAVSKHRFFRAALVGRNRDGHPFPGDG